MKLIIRYLTKEKIWLSDTTYKHGEKTVQIEALKIHRYSLVRRGVVPQRYIYSATFRAPNDAEFQSPDGFLSCSINRSINKHFKPNKLAFVNNWCDLCS